MAAYEIVAFREDDSPIPFFAAAAMENRYDLRRMGRGELNAIYIVWQLYQLDRGSVVLLEEPEAHLAEYSQEALLDAIVAIVVERDLTVIASSHSPGFFQKLPDKHASLVDALPSPSMRSDITSSELARHLGLRRSGSAPLLLVEDFAAAGMLLGIIEELGLAGFQDSPICYAANGESGVLKVLNEITRTSASRSPVLGILDGDQRNARSNYHTLDLGYLPGAYPPEQELRSALDRWRTGVYSEWEPRFARDVKVFKMLLERLDGTDHHDWVAELSKEYGGTLNFMRNCVPLVLLEESRRRESEELADWLDAKRAR